MIHEFPFSNGFMSRPRGYAFYKLLTHFTMGLRSPEIYFASDFRSMSLRRLILLYGLLAGAIAQSRKTSPLPTTTSSLPGTRPTSANDTQTAIRVVRFRIDYPNADLNQVSKFPNWSSIMRKSVLASLRFVNKHWIICGESESWPADK